MGAARRVSLRFNRVIEINAGAAGRIRQVKSALLLGYPQAEEPRRRHRSLGPWHRVKILVF
jgi:hypothetical protein